MISKSKPIDNIGFLSIESKILFISRGANRCNTRLPSSGGIGIILKAAKAMLDIINVIINGFCTPNLYTLSAIKANNILVNTPAKLTQNIPNFLGFKL